MDLTLGRSWVICGALTIGGVVLPLRAEGPATQPAAPAQVTPDEQKQIDRAIAELGSGNYATREAAAKVLWELGDKAIPALKEAASGDDPETKGRARALLENFSYGVRPDTPKTVIDLLNQYKNAGADQRPAIARALAGIEVFGPRVLAKIIREEKDPDVRVQAMEALAVTSRAACARLIAEGDDSAARLILETISGLNEATARDYATLLAVRGGMGPELQKLEKMAANPADEHGLEAPARMAFLLRANGDLAGAARAAIKGGDAATIEALLSEAGDWKTLATRLDARGVDTASVEDMAYAAAFNRLSGNQPAAEKWAAELVKYTDENPATHWDAAESLLLNDQVDRAIQVLSRRRNHEMAIEFLAPRLQFSEVLEELNQAKADGAPDYPKLRAKSAGALQFFGKKKEAAAAIEAAVAGDDGIVDFSTWIEAIEAARSISLPPEKIDTLILGALRAIRPNRPQDRATKVFQKAGFDREEQAEGWWLAMRDIKAGESAAATIARIRKIDRKEIAEAELNKMVEEAKASAGRLPLADRDNRLKLVADTLADLGNLPAAIGVMEDLAKISEASFILSRLGELYADAKQWDKAADAFGRAYDRDRAQAAPLLMRGWCLVQAGKKADGQQLIDTAHLMPLGNEAERHEIMTMLLKRGMKEEARRERDLLLRTGELSSWERGDAVRRAAEEALEKNDFLVAADLWDQAFLHNLGTRVSFVEPQANLMIPVMTHRVRAQGLVKAGKLSEAVEQAAICFKSCPGDADSQIDIVRALKEAGHNVEADTVYAKPHALYAKMAADNPQSASAHNLLAWFSGRCERDLDEALVHAKRALELDPDSTAIMDTLAEVHHQRGEKEPALDLVKKCLKLEPNNEHHKKNLERFSKGRG